MYNIQNLLPTKCLLCKSLASKYFLFNPQVRIKLVDTK